MNRLHPLSALQRAINRGIVVGSTLFFLVSMLSGVVDVVDVGWTFVLAPAGFVLGAAYGVAYYYRFAYELTEDTFDVASGVVSRRVREIPYRRIQNVDVAQGVIFSLLGLAVVGIETAGGGETEASLNFVSRDEADRLQREVRRRTAAAKERRRGSTAEEVEADADGIDAGEGAVDAAENASRGASTGGTYDRPTLLFDLSGKELALYAFASFRPAATAGLFFLLALGGEFVVAYLFSVAELLGPTPDPGAGVTPGNVILSVVSLAHVVLVPYAISVVYTFLSYYGFRLGKAGDDLVYERGLLQRYSGSIPLEKVQSVTVTDNPVQRHIGYAGLWVETAGYGPGSDSGSQSAVPLARVDRIYQFAERLSGVERPQFTRPTTVARRRYVARYAIVATVVVAVAFAVSVVSAFDAWYLATVTYLVAPVAAHLRWTHLGYYVGEDHLVVRSGFWRRRTTVIPYYRIQTVATRRTVFQRRLGLASLVADTASSRDFVWSTPRIYDVDLEVAREVHDHCRERLDEELADRSGDSGGLTAATR